MITMDNPLKRDSLSYGMKYIVIFYIVFFLGLALWTIATAFLSKNTNPRLETVSKSLRRVGARFHRVMGILAVILLLFALVRLIMRGIFG
jgi:hypothetical protein